nr:M23 family metallopeptidase [Bacillus sp. 1NLA3E]
MPTTGTITQQFIPGVHFGIDIANGGSSVAVNASATGTVSRSYYSSSYGEVVFIKHTISGVNYETVYAHMKSGSRTVSVGQTVQQGQRLGYMGSTGDSTGQHLHFELHLGSWNDAKSNAVNPLNYIGSTQSQIYGITVDDISLAKAQQLVPNLQKQYSGILAADLIYGMSDGIGYKIIIKGINHQQAVQIVPRAQYLTSGQVPNYDTSLTYGVQIGPSPINDNTAYEVHVTGIRTLQEAQNLVPQFQSEFAWAVLATRVRGELKSNGLYKVVLEGFTLQQAQVVRNEIAAQNPDIPNGNVYGYILN